MSQLIDFYGELHQASKAVLDESFNYDLSTVGKTSQIAQDLYIWAEALNGRPEQTMLISATRELQFAQFALLTGSYKHGFSGLRNSLELVLSSAYFGSNEFRFRLWEKDLVDIRWSELLDENEGILSPRFAKAFFPELEVHQGQIRLTAGKLYRELSQFVHSNSGPSQLIPEVLTFSKESFDLWAEMATTTSFVCAYVLSLRYLLSMEKEKAVKLESAIMDQLGTLAAIQGVFGGKQ